MATDNLVQTRCDFISIPLFDTNVIYNKFMNDSNNDMVYSYPPEESLKKFLFIRGKNKYKMSP